MRLHDILGNGREVIFEYGRKGFPGYGMGLFGQRFYEYMVNQLHDVSDPQARTWLVDWLSQVFQRDNGKFNAGRFQKAVADNKHYNARPSFQQRHFYYLAHWVKEIQDKHIHDFVRDWLGRVAGGTNSQFKASVWNQYCNHDEPVPPKPSKLAAPPAPAIDDLEENTALNEWGTHGHGGFGKKVFTRSHYLSVAGSLGAISDPAIKQHMIQWWVKVFKLDNPAFKSEAFEAAAESARGRAPNAIWQQRHFYFVAHEIAEIPDIHERKFVCDWFAKNIGYTNGNFQVERWEKYCHLEPESYERKDVAPRRAKAKGEPVGEHPSEERF
jgi:hypothetical protein